MHLDFEWDEEKAELNLRKHGVGFQVYDLVEEAKSVFGDPLIVTHSDPDHSVGEHRFLSIGQSFSGRTLIVIHTSRGDKVRIITARKATKFERGAYEEGQQQK